MAELIPTRRPCASTRSTRVTDIYRRVGLNEILVVDDAQTAAAAAQKEIGLDLTEEQKKAFAQRYIEERRKIEEDLRRQMEESRRPKVKALVEKLRQEFAAQPVKTP